MKNLVLLIVVIPHEVSNFFSLFVYLPSQNIGKLYKLSHDDFENYLALLPKAAVRAFCEGDVQVGSKATKIEHPADEKLFTDLKKYPVPQ